MRVLLAVSTTPKGYSISHIVVTSPAFHHQIKKQGKKNQEEESGLDHIPFNRTLLSLSLPQSQTTKL